MEKNKFFLLSAQCAMFFHPMVSLDKKEKISLLSEITDRCGTLLSGEPTILPIPLDAPPDIPRLQLNSKDNSYAYGISLKRSDLSFNQIGDPNKKLTGIPTDLFKNEEKILEIYKNDRKWNISRLAIIVNYLAELDNKTSDFISKKFIANSPVCNSIELSFLKKAKIDNFNINRWFRIKCVEKRENALHLMIDINTLAEERLDLSAPAMMKFYENAIPYVEKETKETFEGF